MKVLLASHMGMCFGVKDAIEVSESVAAPELVTIHGELVHNRDVQRHLTSRGFHTSSESQRARLPKSPLVLITAHGVSNTERERLEAAGKQLIDTTCPLVRRVHQAALQLEERNGFVVIVGRHGHVEVEGIVGDLNAYAVIQSRDEVENFGRSRLGVLSQSTTPPWLFEEVCDEIRKLNPHSECEITDTICAPTRERQDALTTLLDQVEALVVVGGANSNNTKQLCRQAELSGIPSFHVQDERGLDFEALSSFEVVGLTAGTSTPDSTIRRVHAALTDAAIVATPSHTSEPAISQLVG